MKHLPLSCALALCVLGASAADAHAAACCMSATSGGFGRLLSWEKAAAGLQLSGAPGMGFWTSDGVWLPYTDYAETEWRANPWALVRASRRTSFFAAAPLVYNVRSAGDIDDSAIGFGDATAGVRYEAIGIGERLGWPAIAVTGSVVAPTGVGADAANGDLASDATGRGSWVVAAGTSLEYVHEPFFVRGDVGVAIPLPHERRDTGDSQRFGESVQLTLTSGYEISAAVVVSVTLQGMREAAIVSEGERVDDSARTDVSAGLGLSVKATDHVTFTGGASTGIFADGLGDNQQGRVVGNIGVRYGFF